MLLGVIVIFLPFLGFPTSWDTVISVLAGILIIGIAYKISPITKYGSGTGGSNYANVPNSNLQNAQEMNDTDSKKTSSRDLPFVEHQSGAINSN